MRSLILALAASLGVAAPALARAPETKSVKITLDWAFQGPQSVFLYGVENGEFRRRGIEAQVDRGTGSSDTLVRVASGAYQFGWADIATMIKFNAENPGKGLEAVYVTGGNSPLAVVTVAGRGIKTPKDLEGRTLGAAAGSAALSLFNAFAADAGFDPAKVKWKILGGALREPMMVRGDVDALAGFTTSSIQSVVDLGIPLNNVVVMRYNDFGVKQYGTAIVMRPDFARANPNTTKAVLAAINAAFKDAIANPQASTEAIRARDPLVNVKTECARLVDGLQTLTLTDEFKKNGLSSTDDRRMNDAIRETLKAFNIEQQITADKVFDTSYLPPQADRVPPALGACS
jgi:NitT/TauT family transport system substrate-binding protein